MKLVESIKLPEVFGLVSKPRYILGTTFTLSLAFFESAIFPEIDRSRLKSCLILCDAIGYDNALTEAAALQGAAQDYMVVRAPMADCFHAKVWLVIGEDEAVLMTGSGNLTQAGFMMNAELFDALHFTPESPPSPEMSSEIRSFVTGLAGMWQKEDAEHLLCIETLHAIEQEFADFGTAKSDEENTSHFLHSFRGPLIDQLPPNENAKDLFIAAPYFRNSLEGLNTLTGRYSTARLHLFPAVHAGDVIDVSVNDVRKAYKSAHISSLVLSAKKRLAHLKLYGVADEKNAWIFCASANCTRVAWQGPNVEAGLLRTVPPSLLPIYFLPSSAELPTGQLQIHFTAESAGRLELWASDTGGSLALRISEISHKRMPLADVTLTARCGSILATCHKSHLFQNGLSANLPWTAFNGWQRRRKTAVFLEIHAHDAEGKDVRAACLVENQMLLTADPIHRSAWRGAQALLDAEGAPELGDIAAIFSLAADVFDGKLIQPPAPKTTHEQVPAPTNDDHQFSVAVWPPQADTNELRKTIGHTALGQLQWFQQILRTFLHTSSNLTGNGESEYPHESPPGGDEHDYENAVIEDDKTKENGTHKKAQHLWDFAYRDYVRLRERLWELCPDAPQASNIWPAAIFAFLSTMAVFRAVKRMAPDIIIRSQTSAAILCDDFFRAMFSERQQDDDFCCPKGFRYRYERFPALANDLRGQFKITVHADLTNIIVALIVDRRLRNPTFVPSSLAQKQQLALICDAAFEPNSDAREVCRRVWRRYMYDESRKATDADFEKQFANLFATIASP